MQIIDEEKSFRPSQGYESGSPRNVRLQHKCWKPFLETWPDIADPARLIIYADGNATSFGRLHWWYAGAHIVLMLISLILYILGIL